MGSGRLQVESAGAAHGLSPGFAAAHARLLHDRRFQFDFPPFQPPKVEPPPAWLIPLLRALAAVMPYLFWAALIGGGGFVLFLLGRELLRGRGAGGGKPVVLTQGGLAPTAARARARLEEADRLASEGRFGEAVRTLLFRTLDDIDERRPGLLTPNLTSREIARLPALPAPARPPLSRIAAAVEQVVFAGRETDGEGFAAARADYLRFVEAAA